MIAIAIACEREETMVDLAHEHADPAVRLGAIWWYVALRMQDMIGAVLRPMGSA